MPWGRRHKTKNLAFQVERSGETELVPLFRDARSGDEEQVPWERRWLSPMRRREGTREVMSEIAHSAPRPIARPSAFRPPLVLLTPG